MDRQFTSVEILEWENNALAIENAIEVLKARLGDAPTCVLNDVLQRCTPEKHGELIDWLSAQNHGVASKRVPRTWSPKRNKGLWTLYAAADLDRPALPPN